MENVIPSDPDTRREQQLTYYQWVPFILLFMAMLFKIPRITWKVLTYSSSISLDKVVGLIYALQLAPRAERDEKIAELTEYLDTWLQTSENHRKDSCLHLKQKISKYTCFVCGRRYGNHFITSALFVKFLYFANAFMQYFALNAFLGEDFAAWGFEILTGLADENPEYLRVSPRFPRVTLCDFQIRQMMNVQRWTVQCVLPINLFNSKIFLFIWFWLVFLCVSSLISLCSNLYASMFPARRIEFVRKYLTLRRVITYRGEAERRLTSRFVMSYLKFDGFYVLRVAAHNATDLLVAQIIENLYQKFKERRIESKEINGGDYV